MRHILAEDAESTLKRVYDPTQIHYFRVKAFSADDPDLYRTELIRECCLLVQNLARSHQEGRWSEVSKADKKLFKHYIVTSCKKLMLSLGFVIEVFGQFRDFKQSATVHKDWGREWGMIRRPRPEVATDLHMVILDNYWNNKYFPEVLIQPYGNVYWAKKALLDFSRRPEVRAHPEAELLKQHYVPREPGIYHYRDFTKFAKTSRDLKTWTPRWNTKYTMRSLLYTSWHLIDDGKSYYDDHHAYKRQFLWGNMDRVICHQTMYG